MNINPRTKLENLINERYPHEAQQILNYLPNIDFDTTKIKAVMINEIVANNPENDFYGIPEESDYLATTIPLFHKAGLEVKSMTDIIDLGIYITSAVKLPKTQTTISKETIQNFLPVLKKELELFPNLQAIMLNGDVAKKAFNFITKEVTGKNAVPAVSTYKLRNTEVYYEKIRIFPAYIMTGKNILIEKSKVAMTAEDIAQMVDGLE